MLFAIDVVRRYECIPGSSSVRYFTELRGLTALGNKSPAFPREIPPAIRFPNSRSLTLAFNRPPHLTDSYLSIDSRIYILYTLLFECNRPLSIYLYHRETHRAFIESLSCSQGFRVARAISRIPPAYSRYSFTIRKESFTAENSIFVFFPRLDPTVGTRSRRTSFGFRRSHRLPRGRLRVRTIATVASSHQVIEIMHVEYNECATHGYNAGPLLPRDALM